MTIEETEIEVTETVVEETDQESHPEITASTAVNQAIGKYF